MRLKSYTLYQNMRKNQNHPEYSKKYPESKAEEWIAFLHVLYMKRWSDKSKCNKNESSQTDTKQIPGIHVFEKRWWVEGKAYHRKET